MRVLHITPSFYPARVYGGPTESVYQLGRHLVRQGHRVSVLTTNANGPNKVLDVTTKQEVEMSGGLYVRYCRRLVPDSISPMLLRLLPSYIRCADVVHLTGAYSFPTIPTFLACHAMDKPLVWSPRGTLQRWERSFRRPTLKAIWDWVCRIVIPKKIILHVTSETEAAQSLERFPGTETALIPNGVEVPKKVEHIQTHGVLRLLYLGRIHPKKGIENLLAACRILKGSSGVVWLLSIAGGGGPRYTNHIREGIERLALSKQVTLVGEVVGDAKKKLFEKADVVVVPSFSENFGMVVAEALAHGVPVIVSKGTPWKRVEEIGCGLWVENDPQSLSDALQQIAQMPLRRMGSRGRAWMQQEFAWPCMARRMAELYESLVIHST